MTANTVNGAHLLLVEDEPVASKMLSCILDLEGFRVTTAPDGVSALELMAEGPARCLDHRPQDAARQRLRAGAPSARKACQSADRRCHRFFLQARWSASSKGSASPPSF